jgi:hypothetical protein
MGEPIVILALYRKGDRIKSAIAGSERKIKEVQTDLSHVTASLSRDAAITARKLTPAIQAFLDAAAPAQRNMSLASWAVICGLRSERWQHPIMDSYQQYMREAANRFRIGNDGLDAADMQSKTIAAQLSPYCESVLPP